MCYQKSGSQQHQHGSHQRKDQHDFSVGVILQPFDDPYPGEKAECQGRQQIQIRHQSLRMYVVPVERLQRQLEQVHAEEQPGGGADEIILRHAHRDKIQIGEGAGEVADHGRETGHQPRAGGEQRVMRDVF